jgi:hypothetical protein
MSSRAMAVETQQPKFTIGPILKRADCHKGAIVHWFQIVFNVSFVRG